MGITTVESFRVGNVFPFDLIFGSITSGLQYAPNVPRTQLTSRINDASMPL
jgi:hypothetical protein